MADADHVWFKMSESRLGRGYNSKMYLYISEIETKLLTIRLYL